MTKELDIQKEYLGTQHLQSIYFGGGTPSLVSIGQMEILFNRLSRHFSWDTSCEITLEANPDDLDKPKLKALKGLGINRLSIGIQSFTDRDLILMNRSHNASQARNCIEQSILSGITNLNIDLIFGIPGLDLNGWEENLSIASEYDIDHLSCYSLTIEPGTVFHHWRKHQKMPDISDKQQANQFQFARQYLIGKGFDHYEISNYSRNQCEAIHNTNYWRGEKYLGIGPSAHSYNGTTRQWNINNNPKYIKALRSGRMIYEKEELSNTDLFNEYILTGLRTKWGCDPKIMANRFPAHFNHFIKDIAPFIERKWIIEKNNNYSLSPEGLLFADRVASSLFITK